MRQCKCGQAIAGPYPYDLCRPCWLKENNPAYRRLWTVCPFLGPELRDQDGKPVTRPCPGCGGKLSRQKVFACCYDWDGFTGHQVTAKECDACPVKG